MKRKVYLKKAAAISTAVVLACGVTGCGINTSSSEREETKTESNNKNEKEDEEKLVETMNDITGSDNVQKDLIDKEETVYVIADSNGSPTEVIVSEWLKNVNGEDKIVDATNLTEIKNIKGDEKFENSSTGIVWEAKGSDIYYQGKSKEELPFEVKVTYYLDDKQISPEELPGKSGRVKIRYEYTNKSTTSVKIANKDKSNKI